MNLMNQLKTKMEEFSNTGDIYEINSELESKISLIQDTLTNAVDGLDYKTLIGLSYVVDDVEEKLTKLGAFAATASRYHYFLNNPEALGRAEK